MEDLTLINGLLAKRSELVNLNAELRERMAVVANDIETVERVLDSSATRARPSPLPARLGSSCSTATSYGSTC